VQPGDGGTLAVFSSMVMTAAEPAVWSAPPAVSSRAQEAIELAATVELFVDPWQAFVLEHGLGVAEDGGWSAFEVGVDVSRQNGKGGILEVRELAGLFCWGERLVIHSAHQFDTSMEAFLRMEALLEASEDLSRKVRSVSRSHGSEGFVLTTGQRLRYRTRTKGGGRGFSGDCLVLDEAMVLPEAMIGALLPTLSARPDPQVWYAGSAVDQLIHDEGVVLARLRERGHKGDHSLAWFEWTADRELLPSDPRVEELLEDPAAWAAANPALGIRISEEHVANERRSMDPRTFAVERLGIGDWPDTDPLGKSVIPLDVWDALIDVDSKVLDPVRFAYDVSPDRSSSAISVAGKRADGFSHVEVIDHRAGTGWVVSRLAELTSRHRNMGVFCDGVSPAASLVPELKQLGVKVTTIDGREQASACGMLFDAVEQRTVRHLGTPELRAAIRSASTRPLGDSWAWARKKSSADISPLVSVTVALWATLAGKRQSVYAERAAVAV
jgi:hypothetical protein